MLKLRIRLLTTALLLAFSLSCSALLFPLPQAVHTAAPETVTVQPETVPPLYELRSEEGEICIYHSGKLFRHTGVFVSSLPREDRALLEEGIAADSDQALASLLEDLCS